MMVSYILTCKRSNYNYRSFWLTVYSPRPWQLFQNFNCFYFRRTKPHGWATSVRVIDYDKLAKDGCCPFPWG